MDKLIVIEGTDCSGKQTQAEKLVERLKKEKVKIAKFSFPDYETPTGKIVGGPYLGKSYICDGWFPEGAPNVSGKVASLYYAADRLYNIEKVKKSLKENEFVIIDRYVESNMAFQVSKFDTKEERLKMFKWLETLEYEFLNLPRPEKVIFLYMPYEYACELKRNREEKPDQNELDENLLRRAESTYLELAELYNFDIINCVKDGKIRTIDDIHEEVYTKVKSMNRRTNWHSKWYELLRIEHVSGNNYKYVLINNKTIEIKGTYNYSTNEYSYETYGSVVE